VTLAARYAARSDIGLNRQTNEDAWLVRPPLFAVADGMGGAQAGEVASRVALQTLSGAAVTIDPRDRAAAGEALLAAAHQANRRVWELSREYPSQAGMGTTLTALVLCPSGARLVHIGDSRAYVVRGGELMQITDDHSLVAEMVRSGELAEGQAPGHPLRSVLSRALGTEPEPQIDLLDVDLESGDVVLLCSDGLTGPVPAGRIAELLGRDDPEAAAEALVTAALDAGGPDNITVVVIRLEEAAPAAAARGVGAQDAAVAAATGAVAYAASGSADGAAAAPETADDAVAASGQTPAAGPPDAAGTAELPITATAASDTTAELPTAETAAGPTTEHAAEPPIAGPAARAADGPAPRVEPAAGPGAAAAPMGDAPGVAPVRPPDAAVAAARPTGGRRWLWRLIAVVAVLTVVAGGVLALGQLEWVGAGADDVVTVYRGVPWEFGGLRLYRVHERAPELRYGDLTAAQRREVDAHSVGWRGSGERLLDSLRGGP
jgi:protein phosphatase